MKPRRIQRVNSLLKEVLSEVIMHDIKHRNIPELITITEVDTAADLTSAKVFISLIADSRQKKMRLWLSYRQCLVISPLSPQKK